ncbi:Phosphoribosyl-AMP cyclohydrolase [Candidatus Nasuia deltocephalinicola]|uniref:phosphoribosyl-AMP cyclohydrolase n=1 Tax=Candidatus Nasuia deltocephalincola TaxID=1160784 RepID=A0A7G6UHI1_9PROT|nr:Phosphoribosyl-AMP cyclohydrolase [Candidatus Nasuia deltocephalinicola]
MLNFKKFKKFIINNYFFLNWNYFNNLYIILKNILNNKIIMFAFFNYTSMINTIFNKYIYYYSRSKNYFWFKGKKSKHFQIFKNFYIDCDMDFVLINIFQTYKICCHINYFFCSFNKILNY